MKLEVGGERLIGFWLERNVLCKLRDDTQIAYSDKRQAKPSDLKVGPSSALLMFLPEFLRTGIWRASSR